MDDSRRYGVHVAVQPGLTQAEAAERLAARGPRHAPATSRSTRSIVRANTLTLFNAILAVAGAATLLFANWRDALFLGILVGNTAIGIVQELRAKRALDRLAALVAPSATVIRGGVEHVVAVGDVVTGDLVLARAGDQIVADGTLVEGDGVRLDESVLTGESRGVPRSDGEEVRSGSFVTEGAAHYVAQAVGPDSYAEQIAGEARAFRHPRSPLERGLNRLLTVLVIAMVPLGIVFAIALAGRNDLSTSEVVSTAVAGLVSLVPEGLILLASLTAAVAAVRMASRGALVQQLNAVESLASVDVMCMDKTGDAHAGRAARRPGRARGGRGRGGGERRSRRCWRRGPRTATGRWRRSTTRSPRRSPRSWRASRSPRGGAGARSSSPAERSCSVPRRSSSWAGSPPESESSRQRAGASWRSAAAARTSRDTTRTTGRRRARR